jgi:carboxymethylenebutenolidase
MDDDGRAYVAEPAGPPAGGVVVVHDWFGRLPHVRLACDDLAEAGLVALAPDLYDGRTTTDPEQAEQLMGALDAGRAGARLAAAADELRGRTGGRRVGALGFSMGGSLVLLEATSGKLDAVAAYYAALEEHERAPIPCPVLLQLAEADDWEPPDTPERFAVGLRAAGTEVEVHTWPGTGHSFANRDVPAHAAAQAAEAWAVTVAFLRRHLDAGS